MVVAHRIVSLVCVRDADYVEEPAAAKPASKRRRGGGKSKAEAAAAAAAEEQGGPVRLPLRLTGSLTRTLRCTHAPRCCCTF